MYLRTIRILLVMKKMQLILDTVKQLSEKVQQLEQSQGAQSTSSNLPNAPVDITIDELRDTPNLAERADAYLSQQSGIAPSAGKNTKNPRLSSSKKIVHQILWPHHYVYRPGKSDLSFDDLSISEFVAGTAKILLLPEITDDEKRNRTEHLHYLMYLSSYNDWTVVRNMYGAALKDIQCNLRKWSDSLSGLKDLLLQQSQAPRSMPVSTASTSAAANQSYWCRKFNFSECKNPNCRFDHKCVYCWSNFNQHASHPSKRCNKKSKNPATETQPPDNK